jgi:hypothetical protein
MVRGHTSTSRRRPPLRLERAQLKRSVTLGARGPKARKRIFIVVIYALFALVSFSIGAATLNGGTASQPPRPRNVSSPAPGTPALWEAGQLAASRFQCRGG